MDIRSLIAAERRELVGFLRALTDEEWETPSLCAGWRVRDVVAHLLYDATSVPAYVGAIWRARGSVEAINGALVDRERRTPPARLVDRLEASIGGGIFSRVAPGSTLADVLVHQQDIRRPLGRLRHVPEEQLVAVLEKPDPFARPKQYTQGLRFVATDLDWAGGEGPEVRGPGEALALAMVGRPVVLDELSGDGVPTLRERMPA
ncbi:maleylpyruvate isomerase family mycothiol-dependent enzyme [Nocardioides speluncae]|uniref:maleylpyruvate isomerase family mycothiol-dependent enzyme n=1 Tax=Nocardioides speluncae TaxID=2670337 RepID=UPI000D69616E|nr:maleylpyruvate isomerase family mycothiol-dependent enzyme [Nocardioides speluncae]